MFKILRLVHFAWFFFWVVFVNVLFLPGYYIFSRSPKFYGALNALRTLACHIVLLICGFFVRFHFEEAFDRKKTFIYCANHFSSLDILVMCILCKGRFNFMGKQELMENPFWRIFFSTIDIPVNRENKIAAFKAFKRAGDSLSSGRSLIIFPEGKIGDEYPPFLHEFKNGPFRLAIERNIPIVAVSISNLWKHMWDDGSKHGTKPGVLHVYVHKPFYTIDMEVAEADALKDKVFNTINSKMVDL